MGAYGEQFKCSINGMHRSDHIRDFILKNKGKHHPYTVYAKRLGVDFKTIMYYANGGRSTSIDIVEAFLNEMGYTLQVVPLTNRSK